jgi:recombination protein RecT
MTTSDLRSRTRGAAGQAQAVARRETSQDVAVRELSGTIQRMGPELARALPKHITADRVVRVAMTAVRKSPKLAQCDELSFLGALLTAAQLGLEVNTPKGEAYLIPYGKECTFVLGYQGLAELFWRSPLAATIDAQVVHENDQFYYKKGLSPELDHTPARRDRGEIVYYWGAATLINGGKGFEVLTPDEVKNLRRGKVGPSGDIPDPMRWMERKTALKQAMKLMPKSVELAAAIRADENVRREVAPLDSLTAQAPMLALGPVLPDADVVNPTTGEIGTPAEFGWPQAARIPSGVEVADPEEYGGES